MDPMSPRLASGTIVTPVTDLPATPQPPAVLDLHLHCPTACTGDDEHGPRHATVSWTTTVAAPTAQVLLATDSGAATQVVPVRMVATVDARTGVARYAYRARMTRLRPGTRYTLQIWMAGAPSLNTGFRLDGGTAASGPIRLRDEGMAMSHR